METGQVTRDRVFMRLAQLRAVGSYALWLVAALLAFAFVVLLVGWLLGLA